MSDGIDAKHAALLLLAVLSVSTAGAALKKADAVPPVLRAHARVLITTLALLPAAIAQGRYNKKASDPEFRLRFFSQNTLLTILASGVALAAHFGFWLYSLDTTTLTHSLLLVTSHPLIIVVFMGLVNRTQLHTLEIAGAFLGFGGAGLMLLDVTDDDSEVTVVGDVAAFLGAICIVVYLFIGQRLRQWVPLYLYAVPATLVATVALLIASVALESEARGDPMSWIAAPDAYYIAFVAIVPGIGGHTVINHLVKRIPPLLVSVALTMEPVFGTLIGMAADEQGAPGLWTAIGGPITLCGTLASIWGTSLREKRSVGIVPGSIQLQEPHEEDGEHQKSVVLPQSSSTTTLPLE